MRRAGIDPAVLGDAAAWLPLQAVLDFWTAVEDGREGQRGNKAAAARLLGIMRRRLYSRLQSFEDRFGEPVEETT